MSAAQDPSDHHASAATHHEQAAQFHRAASRHYQMGKDYAHAAHQAISAHGHALWALEQGQAASAYYAEQADSPLPSYVARSLENATSTAVATPRTLNGPAHHDVAADHHDAAGRHHLQAAAHRSAEHYIRACHQTRNALDHGKHAIFHGDQAAKHYTEHYGSHPSAELV